jgi:DNA-binding MarR family transcriptional regulator
MMAGEHYIRGLSNANIRSSLDHTPHLRDLADDPRKQSSKVSRILSRFHAHKLIAKIPHTRRWHVTDHGKQIMAASLYLRDIAFPELFRKNMAA